MRLITWNVAGRIRCIPEQIEALRARLPDIVALQEVTTSSYRLLEKGLTSIGLVHSAFSLLISDSPKKLNGPRRYGLLIASRWPLTALSPRDFPIPWPEKVLSVMVNTPSIGLELHAAHVPPGSSNGSKKIDIFAGIYERLAVRAENPRVLCGDFNSPQDETDDGETITWGQHIVDGRAACWHKWRGVTGVEWDRAERNVLVGLSKFDLPDVFRSLHGFGRPEYSWYVNRNGRRKGRRFDHVFASTSLNAKRCAYLHDLREAKLSDHSGLEVDFADNRLRPNPQ